jgi:hypothetical protein
MSWQPIETAEKGGFPVGSTSQYVTDPDWVEPPTLLVWVPSEACVCAARWDWYYAPGGNGFNGDASAWVEQISGERVTPSHWMPLPAPPTEDRPPADCSICRQPDCTRLHDAE